jgi:hypothetical protein
VPNSTLVVLEPNTNPRYLDVLIEKTGKAQTRGFDVVFPNPMKPPVTITFSLPCDIVAERIHHVDIFNSAGQLVRTLPANITDRNNPNSIVWHGMDNQGRRVPNGVYHCCLSTTDTVYTKKIVYLK